jgi:hypothetical protein
MGVTMTKEQRIAVVEYAAALSEDELRMLTARLTDRFTNDLPEALEVMSRSTHMDAVLASTRTANELYDMCDKIRDVFSKECRRKGLLLKFGS